MMMICLLANFFSENVFVSSAENIVAIPHVELICGLTIYCA